MTNPRKANPSTPIQRKIAASQAALALSVGSVSAAYTLTTTASGDTFRMDDREKTSFSLQCVETGTTTSWTVVVEISLDGSNWTTVLSHTRASDGSGAVITTGANLYPATYMRVTCSALSLGGGTNVLAYVLGVS